jgi:hypothetical protein
VSTSITTQVRKALNRLHKRGSPAPFGWLPSVVRMHPALQAALDIEGMTGVEVIKSIEPGPLNTLIFPTRTLAGIPVEHDVSVPADSIIFEDSDGKELSRISGLPVPQPYSEESK